MKKKIGKEEVKLIPFPSDLFLYAGNNKEYKHTQTHNKLLQLKIKYCRIAGYKSNAQISVVFLYSTNGHSNKQTKSYLQ